MLSGENRNAWVKADNASLLSPLLAKAIPSSVHNWVLFGDCRRAARLNSIDLSKSLEPRAERMDSSGLSRVCATTHETQNKNTTQKPSFPREDILFLREQHSQFQKRLHRRRPLDRTSLGT